MTTNKAGNYVGIDVAKDKLDIGMLGGTQVSQVTNDQAGIECLIQEMLVLGPELIVVEATGGYKRAVVLGLFEAGLSVAVGNPQRGRQYARACGVLAKTDKIDALKLAEFGKNEQPRRFE